MAAATTGSTLLPTEPVASVDFGTKCSVYWRHGSCGEDIEHKIKYKLDGKTCSAQVCSGCVSLLHWDGRLVEVLDG